MDLESPARKKGSCLMNCAKGETQNAPNAQNPQKTLKELSATSRD